MNIKWLKRSVFLNYESAVEQDGVALNDTEGPGGQSLASGANDILVVSQKDGSFLGTPISAQIGDPSHV